MLGSRESKCRLWRLYVKPTYKNDMFEMTETEGRGGKGGREVGCEDWREGGRDGGEKGL